ncbi:unnamed protein product [Diamesa hyperborea]
MVLSKIFALLICSVVIACGSSCDNDGNVTAHDVKFLEATGGFFYIHGLTNGESVVMFQTMGDSKIQVQYTFINDDCLYETRSYNIHENGNMKDHVKVVKTRDEFSISNTLFYMGQKYSFVNVSSGGFGVVGTSFIGSSGDSNGMQQHSGGQSPSHELSRAGIEMVEVKSTVSE